MLVVWGWLFLMWSGKSATDPTEYKHTYPTGPSTPSLHPPTSHQHAHGFLKGDEEEAGVAFDEFYPWVAETFPLLYQCFGAFIYSRVCPGLGVPPVSGF